ncbi:MAG: hypothetical protein B6D39_06125 [Anaerolineae bacterium UTCFX2]|jgi:3-mercaptopyruvate sulfurtransferase SseA|nr:rhodanese-like domain-containing protein [Anaerolineae bacterium]MCZ7551681.1 rhodanese-like domain-containing protein [Anaerolineales bacterium]OQY91732.1 MAG: hypothetical protein B6D39_06125 [Anaerolineae bacterium UTCFX2]
MSTRTERASKVPLIIVGLGLLLMVAAVIWFTRMSGPSAASSKAAAATHTPVLQAADIERVSLAEAKAAFDSKQAVFVDARGEPSFSEGHIPGAIPMSSSEVAARFKELDPNAWVLTYCT